MGGLRAFVRELDAAGQLLRISDEVNPRFDIAAVTKEVSRRGGPALYFERVKGYAMPVLTNLLGSMARIALALGVGEEEVYDRLISCEPIEPQVQEKGLPARAIVDDPDLPKLLPILTCHEKDVSPYITQGIVFLKDPDGAAQSMGVHRLQVRGPRRLGLLLGSKTSTEYYHKAAARNLPLEVAIVLGVHPAVLLAAVAWYPFKDKLALAGGLLGQPLRVVTTGNGLFVPADAAIVIEGRVLPGVLETDGPFGESTGFYVATEANTIEVDCIALLDDPLYPAFVPWTREDQLVLSIAYGTHIYRDLKMQFPFVRRVHGTVNGLLVVAVDAVPRARVRQMIHYCLATNHYLKLVIAVNADIALDDTAAVEWAVLNRFQPKEDLIVVEEVPCSIIDPSTRGGIGGKLGIDATYPPGEEERFRAITVPEAAAEKAREILRRVGLEKG